ncbi:hypothetical protein ACFX12_012791 [Malus domestica]
MCSSSLSSIEKRRKKREQPAGGGYGMGGSSSFLQSWADHVHITYRHIASALVMFPFAYVLERKERPKLTFALFLEPFVLPLLGIGLTLNMYFASLRYTSPTFLASIINTIASLTFCNRSCTEAITLKRYPAELSLHSHSRASYCRSQAILAVVGKEGDEVYIKPEERKDNAVQKITSKKKDVLHGEP